MKTTTYWAYYFLSLGALFVILLQIDKLSTFWQVLEGIWLLIFIVLTATLYMTGRRNSSGYVAMLLFGLNMLNALVLYFLTGWLTMLIVGGIINLVGFVAGVEAMHGSEPRTVAPYHEEELAYHPPPPPKRTVRKKARKTTRKKGKKAKRKR